MEEQQTFSKVNDILEELIVHYIGMTTEVDKPDDYHAYALAIKTGLEYMQNILTEPGQGIDKIKALDFREDPKIQEFATEGAYRTLERYQAKTVDNLIHRQESITIDDYLRTVQIDMDD